MIFTLLYFIWQQSRKIGFLQYKKTDINNNYMKQAENVKIHSGIILNYRFT